MKSLFGVSAYFFLALSGYAAAEQTTPVSTSPDTVAVTMGGAYFDPDTVTIRVGDTVVWHNTSRYAHTVTFDPAQTEKTSELRLPAGVTPFDSGKIPGGKEYSHTFTVPGTYDYICVPHEDMGMVGKIIVQP